MLYRHPGRLRPRHLAPSALVLALAGGGLLSLIERRFVLIPAVAASAYWTANLLASLRIASRGNWREAPYLPLAFASIHLAAGAGMLAGALMGLVRRARNASRD